MGHHPAGTISADVQVRKGCPENHLFYCLKSTNNDQHSGLLGEKKVQLFDFYTFRTTRLF